MEEEEVDDDAAFDTAADPAADTDTAAAIALSW